MNSTTHACLLNLDSATLGAWRDLALPADEAARIRTHIPTCAACQARLAEWSALDAAIRAQPEPVPSPTLWTDIQSARARNQRHQRRARGLQPQLYGGVAAAAAVLLVVVSFARLLQLQGGAATTSTTATTTTILGTPTAIPTAAAAALPIAGTPLTWRTATLPPGAGSSNDILTIAFTPADGTMAYACFVNPYDAKSPPAIWVTHDRAATWALAGHLPASGFVTDCPLSVDRFNPSTLVASVGTQGPQAGNADYLSRDGGRTWTQMSQHVTQLSTNGPQVYGLVQTTPDQHGSASAATTHLAISRDGLKTWQSIDQTFDSSRQQIAQYWLNPASGALLATVVHDVTQSSVVFGQPSLLTLLGPPTLWESRDNGSHWTQLAAPSMSAYIVQTPSGSQPWHLCGTSHDSDPANPNPNTLICTTDGGRTWVARPGLRAPVACPQSSCRSATVVNAMTDASLAADGAVVVLHPYGPVKDGVVQRIQGLSLYRLPPGSTQWENLGAPPAANVNTFFALSRPSNGVFWAFTGGTYIGDLFSGKVQGAENGSDSLFVVDYP